MWKLFDNLRRSLVPPALLALLIGGWLLGAGTALFWLELVAVVVFLPALLGIGIDLIRKPAERDWRLHLNLVIQAAGQPLARAGLMLLLLPYDALLCLNAIAQSGIRMLFTRRGLLLWHTPAYARRNARSTLADFFLEMWFVPVVAVGLTLVLVQIRPTEWFYWTPLLLCWLISPVIGWWISTPIGSLAPNLTLEQQRFLRMLARQTWRFFADFVDPRDNWLPPDNFQEYPATAIATRTSPTNIGMALLANLAAYDFGYISLSELLRRTEHTLAALAKLERYHGHFYNWYDTRTLQPLHPHYV